MTWKSGCRALPLTFIFILWTSSARTELCRYVSGSSVIVTEADSVPWPGGPVRIEVLGNDYETSGSPLSVNSVSAAVGGTVAIMDDHRGVLFTPGAGATSGSFQYSVTSLSGRSATGQVLLGADSAPSLVASFIANCTNRRGCMFTSVAPATATDGIRAHSWTFFNKTTASWQNTCRKENVWAASVWCDFTDQGVIQVRHSIHYYDGRVATNGVNGTDVTVMDPHDTDWKVDQNGLWLDATIVHSKEIYPTKLWFAWGDGTTTAVTFASNGGIPDGKIVRHQYRNPGTYDIVLWREKYPAAPEASATIRVQLENRPPVPSLSAQFDAPSGNTLFRFSVDDEFSPADPSAPVRYEFDFGDGSSQAVPPATVSIYTGEGVVNHEYGRADTYLVRLKVTDFQGATGEKTIEWSVPSVRPKADFDFFCEGTNCTFDPSASVDPDGGRLLRYEWTFSSPNGPVYESRLDGAPFQRTMQPSYPYYPERVQLMVIDDDSQGSDTVSKRVSGRPSGRAGVYYALNPCRLYDSRSPSAPWTSGPIHALPARGRCGIPDEPEVQSLFAMVTTINPSSPGSIWRVAEPLGPPSSTYAEEVSVLMTGETKNHSTVLPLFADGVRLGVDLAGASATTHVAVDVFGYFRSELGAPRLNDTTGPVGPLRFRPLDQCVVRDTRTEPPAITSASDAVWDLARCGITTRSAAIWGQFTTLAPASQGWMLMYPSVLTTRPLAALTIAHTGMHESTGMAQRVSSGEGRLATMLSTLDVALGVSGVFEDDASPPDLSGQAGLRFFELGRECIAFSERLTSLQPVDIKTRGNCGVPANAKAVLAKVLARQTDSAALGHIRLYPTGGNLSFATIIFTSGVNSAVQAPVRNLAIVSLGNPGDLTTMFQSFGGNWADAEVAILGYFAE